MIEIKNANSYKWLARMSKEDKKDMEWLVEHNETLSNAQKSYILQIYEKQKLLEKMYGKEEGVKCFFKKMFRGIKK